MSYRFHILNANGSLAPHADRIARSCNSSLAHINQRMPLDGVDIIIYNHPEKIIPELGASGNFSKKDQIEIYLDASLPKFEYILSKILPPMIAHELHHWKRWRSGVLGSTLLDALVAEGMAVHFENELYPENLAFYAHSLNKEELASMEAVAKPHYGDKDYDHEYWFFGSHPEIHKKWAGYSLGFSLLARAWATNPEYRASTAVSVSAHEVIANRVSP